jgi:hypothetical protein
MDGGGGRLPVDSNCGRPSADGLGGWPPRRTSVGSLDASGRPADAAVDVRTRDNPSQRMSLNILSVSDIRDLSVRDLVGRIRVSA